MRRVIIESPFAGPTPEIIARNIRYVRACLRDCLLRGEAAFASHALYTLPGVLEDADPDQRKMGMEAGWSFYKGADLCAVYTDLGKSTGMLGGIERAESHKLEIEERTLGEHWALNALVREAKSLPKMTHRQLEEQRFGFVFGNLSLSTNHRPSRNAFHKMAVDRGWSEEEFELWALDHKFEAP